jgi:hypothetical protein
VTALCKVTSGGEKVHGMAVNYDVAIDPASPDLSTYATVAIPAARGVFPDMPQAADKHATGQAPIIRAMVAIYTNAKAALCADRKCVPGSNIIADFDHEPDLNLPTADSDMVVATQNKPVLAIGGATYPASAKTWSNAAGRGNNVVISGVDA